MTAIPPRIRIISGLKTEYEDHLSDGDLGFIVDFTLGYLREPTNATVDLFLEELDGEWGQKPDPSATDGRNTERTVMRRLAITYAWRRAFDLMKRGRA